MVPNSSHGAAQPDFSCGKPGTNCPPASPKLVVKRMTIALPFRVYLAPRYNGAVPFTLRDFRPADFDTLWRIDQDCFPPGISYSRTELKVYMRRRGSFTLVAIETAGAAAAAPEPGRAGRPAPGTFPESAPIAGFIVAEADRGSGHIITIDVIASARRFGVGSLLLGGAEDRLRAAKCRSVELETAVDNVSALSFYKRHSYSVIRTSPRYYSNGVDALVLGKEMS
jgi:[ribosomal protein S18]-alanine N-acetyltransferase